jgi:predicted kinase
MFDCLENNIFGAHMRNNSSPISHTFATRITSKATAWPLFSSDEIRTATTPTPTTSTTTTPITSTTLAAPSEKYSTAMTSATYSALLRRGVDALNTVAVDATEDDADAGSDADADMISIKDGDDGDVVVMLDATFRRPAERREAMAAASAANARLVFVLFKAGMYLCVNICVRVYKFPS